MLYPVALIFIFVFPEVKSEGCLQSVPTVTVVENCPRNITEWLKSKSRKQCHWITQNCTSPDTFEYHCLSDQFLERFYEVCAPRKYIVGGHCPTYDNQKNSIELNLYQSCKNHTSSCPDVYDSSTAYKYQECYTYATKQNPFLRVSKECECAVTESVFAKVFYILICLIHFMMLLMFLYFIYTRNHMPGLDKPKEINANHVVGCQLKKVSYQNENVMKYPPITNNQKYLNFLPRNENLHDTSAASSNSSVFLQGSTSNTSYL